MAKSIRFVRNIGNIKKRVEANALRNLKDALFLFFIEAQNLTPLDEGKLRDRIDREVKKVGPDKFYAAFIYRQPYARRQHEGLTFVHPKAGEARFIVKALDRHGQRMLEIMGRGIIS